MNTEVQHQEENKSSLKSTLTFFNSKLTQLNNQRLQVNRSKGMARYLAKSYPNLRDLASLDKMMESMSFSLYIMRFSVNLVLLTQLMINESAEQSNDKTYEDLYYSLGNDSLWGIVNLTKFFWLSFSNSQCAGFYGVQLEVMAQLIDILIMVIRFQKYKEESDIKYKLASGIERERLAIEWQNKFFNFVLSFITASSVAVILGLFAFSAVAVPVSPVLSFVLFLSSGLRVLIDWTRDRQVSHQQRLEGANPQHIIKEEWRSIRDRLNDLNQILLNHVFIPAGLFLLITSPVSLLLVSLLAMAVIHYGTVYLIDVSCDVANDASNCQLGV